MRKYIENVLLWGSLWGLEEATLGHFLHLLPIGIGWVFWFPLAYFFMNMVCKKTGRADSVLYTAFLAGAFKLTDLFLPVRIDMVLNPAAAIILEGFSVFALFRILQKRPELAGFLFKNAIAVSLLQKLLYIAYILIIPAFISAIPPVKDPMSQLNSLVYSLINGLTIFVFSKYKDSIKNFLRRKLFIPQSEKATRPAAIKAAAAASPYLLFAIAVIAQRVI